MTADTASPFSLKVITPGAGKTVMLFGVRQDDWIEALERAHGVKL
jgi:hypothetical protein